MFTRSRLALFCFLALAFVAGLYGPSLVSSTPDLLAADGTPYKDIDIATLKEMQGANIKIIDLRRQDEWDGTGVIEGAVKLTAFDRSGNFIDSFPEQFQDQVSTDDKIVLICWSGYRSSRIAEAISDKGYANVYNVLGGMSAWIEGGNPVIK